MHGWEECVPNFSEGHDQQLIADLEAIVREVPGVVFLRSDPGPDQNRTLFTFAGPGRSVRRAAFNLIRGAVERIDLTQHIGDLSTHAEDFTNQKVLIVGKGNSAFETADHLIGNAASLRLARAAQGDNQFAGRP